MKLNLSSLLALPALLLSLSACTININVPPPESQPPETDAPEVLYYPDSVVPMLENVADIAYSHSESRDYDEATITAFFYEQEDTGLDAYIEPYAAYLEEAGFTPAERSDEYTSLYLPDSDGSMVKITPTSDESSGHFCLRVSIVVSHSA